jgi:hypothetical protein
MRRVLLALVVIGASAPARADGDGGDPDPRASDEIDVMNYLARHHDHDLADEEWNAYGQFTWIQQAKLPFHAAYTNFGQPRAGPGGVPPAGQGNSLLPDYENSFSFTATAFAGAKLWPYADVYFAPEALSEQTLSRLTGLGGAISNFEMQKGGTPSPAAYVSRLYLQQTIPIGGELQPVVSGKLSLAKKQPRRRVVLSLGRFSVLDFFDINAYSNEGRRDLINMAFMTYAAYDFNADERGYTYGGVAELYFDDWALRYARTAPPKLPNRSDLDLGFGIFNVDTSPGGQTYGDQIELEHDHVIEGRAGVVRLLAYRNVGYMGQFQKAIVLFEGDPSQNNAAVCAATDPGAFANSISRNPNAPDMCYVRGINVKTGIGLDVEQAITSDFGAFMHAMYADGNSEVEAYLPADRSFAIGVLGRGRRWCRRNDYVGAGFAASWISDEHAKYLGLGGIDGFIGDGKLPRPSAESIGEAMYAAHLTSAMWLSGDYQLIVNPAYNPDRGPVHVLGGRFHIEF